MAGTWFLSHTAYERVTLALASEVQLALPHPAAVDTKAIPTTRTPNRHSFDIYLSFRGRVGYPAQTPALPRGEVPVRVRTNDGLHGKFVKRARGRAGAGIAERSSASDERRLRTGRRAQSRAAGSGPGGGRSLATRWPGRGQRPGLSPEDSLVHMVEAEPDRAQHDALVGERGSEHLGGADAQLVQFPPQRVEQDVGGSGETAAEHDHLRVKGEDQRRGTHGEVAHVAADRRERGTVAAAGGGEDVPCRLVRLVGSRRTTPATQVFLGANPAGRRQRADLPGRPGESAVQLAVDDQAEAGA